MDWIKFITDKDFSFHRISSLLIIVIVGTGGMMIVFSFLKDYFNYPFLFLVLWLCFIIILSLLWHRSRTVFPKGNPDKTNLIIGITTENQTQKERITKDTADEIRKLLTKYGLSNKYDIIVLHNHLSKRLIEIIRRYNESRKSELEFSEDIRIFERISYKMNAKFFVFGDLIKRDSPNGKYLLSVEALIKHSLPSKDQKLALQKEFSNLWNSEIKILEADELNGFRNNAENLFFTASFMLGLATFVDNRFLDGASIWEKLEDYVQNRKQLKEHLPKIRNLKAISYFLQSRLDYFVGNIERSISYNEKFLKITPNDYQSHLIESVKEVNINNRPELALEHIEKAKSLAKGDGTWKYNKFYLLIKLKRFESAVIIFNDIISTEFKQEIDVVYQVIAYNNKCFREDITHIQSHFIIGALTYKKLNQPVEAYEYLEKFLEASKFLDEWKPLQVKAHNLIEEINPILEIKK